MSEGIISQSAKKLARQHVSPIVEFFSVDPDCKHDSAFVDTRITDRKELVRALSAAKGIYAFYNSEMEIIYLGKTKSNLWIEMKNAFNRQMNHYERYYVNHPRGAYKPTSGGEVRKLMRRPVHVYDCAAYFSAYAMDDNDLIDVFEMMLIRIIPNDLINVRMEGNQALREYRRPN